MDEWAVYSRLLDFEAEMKKKKEEDDSKRK